MTKDEIEHEVARICEDHVGERDSENSKQGRAKILALVRRAAELDVERVKCDLKVGDRVSFFTIIGRVTGFSWTGACDDSDVVQEPRLKAIVLGRYWLIFPLRHRIDPSMLNKLD